MRDRATLLITHDLELAAAADEVVVLDAGRVVQRGAPGALDATRRPVGAAARRARAGGGRMIAAGGRLAPGLTVIEHLSRTRRLDTYEVWSSERACSCVAKTLRPDRRGDARARRRCVAGGPPAAPSWPIRTSSAATSCGSSPSRSW